MSYVRSWHLKDALIAAAITLDLEVEQGKQRGTEELKTAAEELLRYVGACQFYLVRDPPPQFLPSRAPLNALSQFRRGRYVSVPRGLAALTALARRLYRASEGKRYSPDALRQLRDVLCKLHEWVLAEYSGMRRMSPAA